MDILDLAVSECFFCGQTIAGAEYTDCCDECTLLRDYGDYNIFEIQNAESENHDDNTTELMVWFLKYNNTRTVFFDVGQAMDYAIHHKIENYEISRTI